MLLIDGAATRTVSLPVDARIPALTVNAPNVTLNTSGAGTINFDQPFAVTSAALFANSAVNFVFSTPFTLVAAANFTPGSGNLTFNSSYTQTSGNFTPGSGLITFNSAFALNGGTFNAPSGTLTFAGDPVTFGAGGTFNHNNGTVAFTGNNANLTLPGTLTFGNVTLNKNDTVLSFVTASTLVVTGSLTLTNGVMSFNSGSTIEAQGAVSIASTFDGGSVNFRFGGSANQAFANNGGLNPSGTWTVNKPAGTVTANTSLTLDVSQPLTITSGSLLLGSGSNLTCGVLTIGATGRLVNNSSTTITLGGNPVNNGIVDLQGGGATCPDSDTILLRSSVNGTRRNWSGTGRFRIVDVDLRDQGAPALTTIYSSTNTGNNLNWTFDAGCPIPLSIAPTSVNLSAGSTQTFTANGTFTPRTFSVAVNNSGGSINSSSGLYTAGIAGVIDTVRVTDVFGSMTDATVNVYTPIPSQLTFLSQPSNATAGQAISPSVTVRILDQFANFMAGATNAVTVAIGTNPGGSTLSGTLTRTAASGVATFNDVSLQRTGTGYTLSATSGALTAGTSSGFTISPGSISQLAFTTQPSTTVAGVAISPAVQVAVQDTFGNLVPTATNPITMAIFNNPGSSVLSGTSTRNAAAGVATFDNLSLNRVGTAYTLSASNSTGPGFATSGSFNINAGPAAGVGFVVQPPDTAPGVVMTPAVTVAVQDSQGNTVPGATNSITIAIQNNPSGGTLAGTLTRNAVNGVAIFTGISINNFGIGYTLRATSGAFPQPVSSPFLIGTRRTVTNTNDSGAGSLRQVMTDANAGAGKQLIEFSIPGSPPFIIAPSSVLPTITNSVIIDATTQPGFSGSPVIEITGKGLQISASAPGCSVRGLAITGSSGIGIEILSGGNTIKGNRIGVSANGNPLGNQGVGIVVGSSNNLIGGPTATDRNIVSVGGGDGIAVSGANNIIQGNFVGTDANGGASNFGNSGHGIFLTCRASGAANGTLVSDNVVSKNINNGISVRSVSSACPIGNNTIQNNLIGLDASGTIPLPNSGNGIAIGNIAGSTGNRITANRLFSNARAGIRLDLQPDNFIPLPNDSGDLDTGANNRQNYPELTSFTSAGGATNIVGSLNSTPSSTFTLEFFSNPSCDASGHGQGETFLGSANVTTGASGIVTFTANLPVSIPSVRSITATATDASGNTSEFSRCLTPTRSISGTITDNLAVPLANVAVSVTGSSSATVITNSQGNYSFPNLPAGGNYTITPVLTNYMFSPPNRAYTNLSVNQPGQNFSGTRTPKISGRVLSVVVNLTNGNGNPITNTNGLAGVAVALSGPVNASTTTDGNGNFAFSNLLPGNYTVTPTRANFNMTPTSANVALTTADAVANFTAQNPLSGRVVFVSGTSLRGMNADGSSIVTISSLSSGSISSPSILNDKIVFSRISYVNIPFPPVTIYDGGIFTINFDGTGLTQLTFGGASSNSRDLSPIWLAGQIVFVRPSTGNELFRMNTNGTNQTRIMPGNAQSPTGCANRIAFTRQAGSSTNIFAVNLDGKGLSQLTTDGASTAPVYSRDCSTILFHRGNNIFKMNADGSGQTLLLAAASGHVLTPETWSPDNTRFAFSDKTVSTGLADIVSVAANGTGPVTMAKKLGVPMPDWGYHFTASTGGFASGPSVVQLGGVTITFSGVSVNGETVANPIPPHSAGDIPAGFVIGDLAYDIATTATFTPPVDVCFTVPGTEATTATAFNRLYLMHSESGALVDRTTSRDFGTRQICATTTTTGLGAFALTEQVDNGLPMINGLVIDSDGNPMSDVTMNLTGDESQVTQTDSDGLFHFVNLTMNGNYNAQPNQIGYVFEESSKDFLDITGEETVVFTGTESTVTISGQVTDENGAGMAGVSLALGGSGTDQTFTDVNGNYSLLNVPAGGTYYISPATEDELVFAPAEAILENLISDASGVNFSLALPGSIAGTVTYGNAAAPPKYISNVTVTGAGSPTVMTTTDAPGATAGQYLLNGFGFGSYTVSLSKTTGQNSITSNDAARIAQHVANTGPGTFTNNNQKVTADVSGNGGISSNDAAKIAQVVAGLPLSPPNLTGTWQFYLPPGPTFPVGASPTSRTYSSVTSNVIGDDYVGLLIGEVTGNWTPTAARPGGNQQLAVGSGPETSVGSWQDAGGSGPERGIDVKLPQMAASIEKEIVIPVNVQGAADKEIISYEFDLGYDATVIQPLANAVDVAGAASRWLSVVTNATEPGLLRVVVYGAMPIDENGVLLNLRFTAVGAAGSVSPLTFERIMFNEGEPRVTVADGKVELF